MPTTFNKQFEFGFVINENELRSISNVVEERFKKLQGDYKVIKTFEVRYRNGGLTELDSIEEVISKGNQGTRQIVELKSTWKAENNSAVISLRFTDLDFDADMESKPIALSLCSMSEDWALATHSELEERILKISRKPIPRGLRGSPKWSKWLYLKAAPIGLSLFLFFIIFLQTPRAPQDTRATESKYQSFGEEYQAELRSRNINDPIEALVLREKLLEKRTQEIEIQHKKDAGEGEQGLNPLMNRIILWKISLPVWIWFFIFLLTPPGLVFFTRAFFRSYFPAYNFCLGDYAEVYQKKKDNRVFWIRNIVIILISAVFGLIATNLFKCGK